MLAEVVDHKTIVAVGRVLSSRSRLEVVREPPEGLHDQRIDAAVLTGIDPGCRGCVITVVERG